MSGERSPPRQVKFTTADDYVEPGNEVTRQYADPNAYSENAEICRAMAKIVTC